MDKLPNTPLTSKEVAALNAGEEFDFCDALVGVPPDARNEVVLIAVGVNESSRLFGYGDHEWEVFFETNPEDAKEGSLENMMKRGWEHAYDSLKEYHGDDLVMLELEVPPHEAVLSVFPTNPIERDDVKVLKDNPAHHSVEPMFVRANDGDIVALTMIVVLPDSDEHFYQFSVGFDKNNQQWKVVSEKRVPDSNVDASPNWTLWETVYQWLMNNHEKERFHTFGSLTE